MELQSFCPDMSGRNELSKQVSKTFKAKLIYSGLLQLIPIVYINFSLCFEA